MRGVILYGPPAAGKDTITQALQQTSPSYRHFRRLKVGSGRTHGYRITTAAALDALRNAGEIIWENHRYGSTYVIDMQGLAEQLTTGILVVHLGQIEAVDAVCTAIPGATWTVVYLWCPREVAAMRVVRRGTGDVVERLKVWDQTPVLAGADLTINTAEVTPHEAAHLINGTVRRA